MSDEYPKPGDTIEITHNNPAWLGKQLVVVECPKRYKGTWLDAPYHAWFVDTNGNAAYFRSDYYKIVSRAMPNFVNLNSNVDKSLDKQRDDNLRGVFT